MTDNRIVKVERQSLSPWVTLIATTVARAADGAHEVYHSFGQADYVNILAVGEDGRIPLVRQFRPGVQRATLELPGGLLDSGGTPAQTAARELMEETGYAVIGEVVLLGTLLADSSRLENRFWCFFARARASDSWRAEPGVERVLFGAEELRTAMLDGRFDHGLHVALVGLATLRGYLRWPA
jgi:ADP-ribose pyrophosphatase